MPVSDHIPAIDALILSGMMAKDAFAQVAEETGIPKGSLVTAYYRTKKLDGRKAKSPRARRPPVRGEFAPPKPAVKNGASSGNVDELMARLRRNTQENEEILAALEAAIAEHVGALARVRELLRA